MTLGSRRRSTRRAAGLLRSPGRCARRFFKCCRRWSASSSTSCGFRYFFSRWWRSRPKCLQSLCSSSVSCSTSSKLTSARFSFTITRRAIPRLVPQAEHFQLLQLAWNLFKALIERAEDFIEPQLSGGVLATALCFPGVHNSRWFLAWHMLDCRSVMVSRARPRFCGFFGLAPSFLAEAPSRFLGARPKQARANRVASSSNVSKVASPLASRLTRFGSS
jgi:hypothetical protein